MRERTFDGVAAAHTAYDAERPFRRGTIWTMTPIHRRLYFRNAFTFLCWRENHTLLAAQYFTFARVGAVVAMDVEDSHPRGKSS